MTTNSGRKVMKTIRRPYRERPQLPGRRKLGMLEKKRDYTVRARDHQQKRDRLKKLEQAARLKNVDEFTYGMINAQMKGGVHKFAERDENLTEEEKKLIGTQDATYMQLRVSQEQKKIERLRENLHFVDVVTKKRAEDSGKAVFLSKEEARQLAAASKLGDTELKKTLKAMVSATGAADSSDTSDVEDVVLSDDEQETLPTSITNLGDLKSIVRARDRAYAELQARVNRVEKIKSIKNEVDTRRGLQAAQSRLRGHAGGGIKKIGTDARGNKVYKLAKERLR
ncbi:hypothetical protein H696_03865 [Fonticula alba]|uniref:U3 small nucleolar RNA-associated protein 11 n=1 Tax=Fonticula alba TaxID=691883 RepID=A0A058Z5Q4_FONAL|nr:hypothetical protein H696_03865 [Fonticula alba]KCV69436.1 hypothetical protein H696_03865 [Fonticula alba]|eukprot:XP_009496001.1 hypothetical protein H696_03865 [Fonticula alba]